MKYKESLSQIALLKWFKLQYPKLQNLLVGYPAGTYLGLQSAVRMKAMGLRAGMPDLQLLVPRVYRVKHQPHPEAEPMIEIVFVPGLFIEMKSDTGRVSKVQKDFHQELKEQNYSVVVAYSCEDAQQEIKKYLMSGASLLNVNSGECARKESFFQH